MEKNKIIKVGNYGSGHHAKDIYSSDGVMATLTTGNHGIGQTISIKNNTKKGYLEANIGDGINISGRMEHQRGNVQKGMTQTLKTSCDVGVVVKDERSERERERVRVRSQFVDLLHLKLLNLWDLMRTITKHLKNSKVIALYSTKRVILLEFLYSHYL